LHLSPASLGFLPVKQQRQNVLKLLFIKKTFVTYQYKPLLDRNRCLAQRQRPLFNFRVLDGDSRTSDSFTRQRLFHRERVEHRGDAAEERVLIHGRRRGRRGFRLCLQHARYFSYTAAVGGLCRPYPRTAVVSAPLLPHLHIININKYGSTYFSCNWSPIFLDKILLLI